MSNLLIETERGPVLGFEDTFYFQGKSSAYNSSKTGGRSPVLKWLGIPYAKAGRWERPKPVDRWTEPRKAWEYGTKFPQVENPFWTLVGKRAGIDRTWVKHNEDSHFVNVFAPKGCEPGSSLPVMVWVYGGSYENGSSDDPLYEPIELIRKSVDDNRPFVLVTGNYRTNIFGFFSGPDVAATDPDGLSGNYGLYDVISIFEWVQRNIHKFGGNSDNVTAFGESAGAHAISQLLCSRRKLFHKAILQSGAPLTIDTRPVETAYRCYAAIIDKFCSDATTSAERMSMLRQIPSDKLLAAHAASMGSRTCNVSLEEGPQATWTRSVQLRLEEGDWDPWIKGVVVGTTEDEGTSFVFMDPDAHSRKGIAKMTKNMPEQVSKEVQRLYPENPDRKDFTKSPMALLSGHFTFDVPCLLLAKAIARKGGCPVWMYRYRQFLKAATWGTSNYGVSHGMELAPTFQIDSLWEGDEDVAKTARAMNQAWVDFATAGTPGSHWNPFTSNEQSWLAFNPSGYMVNERIEGFEPERVRILSDVLMGREIEIDSKRKSQSRI